MKGKEVRSLAVIFSASAILAAAALVLWLTPGPSAWLSSSFLRKSEDGITKEKVAAALRPFPQDAKLPDKIQVNAESGEPPQNLTPRYGLDAEAQAQMEKLFSQYSPDYGAFVAIDASTGRILSLVSYTRAPTELGNLALKSIFPAASVFKLVTATAVVDRNKASPETVVAFNGANHTLYRRNVISTTFNRWTRYMTLREAFAKSVNTVFSKIGLYYLNPQDLEEYAHRFKFNESIPTDVPVEAGRLNLDREDPWSIAEVASGFTRESVMSPLQGALMAASVANDGVMMEPYLVEELRDAQNQIVYRVKPKPASVTMNPKTATEIRELMQATVQAGTGRKTFRGFNRGRRALDELEVGAKSGSLTALNPKGKCDWFVGYARYGETRIALAALTIHERQWRVKSSYLARRFIENYFGQAWMARPSAR